MRFVYLDEGGVSKPTDPHIVVAGVMVHADAQWKIIEKYLKDMADDFCRPEDREGFCFHASELSWGTPEFRAKYDDKKRLFFLRSICDIPRIFELPVFMHSVRRQKLVDKYPDATFDEINTQALMHAAIGCAIRIENTMRDHLAEEVAMLVYEQNGKKSMAIRNYHNVFRGEKIREYIANNPPSHITEFTKIIDTAHFCRKEDSSLLQIADFAVHVFTRRLRGAEQDKRAYQSMLNQLTFFPADWKGDVDSLPETWDAIQP